MLKRKKPTFALAGFGSLVALALASACVPTQNAELWLSVPEAAVKATDDLIARFNASHKGQEVSWKNFPADQLVPELQASLQSGGAPTMVVLSQEQARQFPVGTFGNWRNKLSPATLAAPYPVYRSSDTAAFPSIGLPLHAKVRITFANHDLYERFDKGAMPHLLGDVAKLAPDFQKRMGVPLWLPTLGDPAFAMEMLTLQGVPILDAAGQPAFAGSEGRAALRWWAQQFKQGVFPPSCFDLTTQTAQRLFADGKVALASGVPEDILVLRASGKVKNIAPIRDIGGASLRSRADLTALYRLEAARLTMGAQNLVDYLYQPDSLWTLANAANALPATRQAIKQGNPGSPLGGDALGTFNFLATAYVDLGTTTFGEFGHRDLLARVIRQAFLSACLEGMSPDEALSVAVEQYRAGLH